MNEQKDNLENDLKKFDGLVIAITFAIFGLLMVLNLFKINNMVAKGIGITFLIIAFAGLTLEIKTLLGEEKEKKFFGISDIIGGIILFIISIYLIFKVEFIVVKSFMCFFNFFSIYLFVSGIVKFLGCLDKQMFKKNIFKSIFLFAVQITTFVLTILQLYDILIKK